MQGLLSELINSILDMPRLFEAVATSDPISAVLLAIGGLLIAFSVGVLGFLTLGAVVEIFTPEPSAPPQH